MASVFADERNGEAKGLDAVFLFLHQRRIVIGKIAFPVLVRMPWIAKEFGRRSLDDGEFSVSLLVFLPEFTVVRQTLLGFCNPGDGFTC